MLDLILKAFVTGFLLSVLIGPVFFMLLETSIRKGVRAAVAFDLGVLLSDLIYIAIAYIFYSEVAKLTTGENAYLFQFFGGMVFIVFGTVTLIKKPKGSINEAADMVNQTKDYLLLGLKGFLLNFANPAVIVYWFSVLAFGEQKPAEDGGVDNTLIYILIILFTFFSFDLLKILGAKKLRPFITDAVLTGLNRLTGLIILITGIVMFFKGVTKFL